VFRIILPLNEGYSVDSQQRNGKKPAIKIGDKKPAIKIGDKKPAITRERLQKILESMQKNIEYSTEEIAEKVDLKNSRTRELLKVLVENNKVAAIGVNRNRRYIKK